MIPEPLTKTVKTRGGDFTVRGLSLEDITVVLNAHLPRVTDAVQHYQTVKLSTSYDDFALSLATMFPDLVATVIARAAEDDNEAKVSRLPVRVTVQALVAIAELTLEDMGDLTDPSPALAAIVRRAVGGSQSLLALLSPTSTGGSVAP